MFNSCSSSSELDSQYPQFPSEKQLKHNLVSVQDCSEEPKHTVLLKFLEDRHRLAVGSALLPDLVEFYLWLDVHLAHLIRYEVAQTLSVGELIERVEARPRSTGKKLQTLYGRLMSMWLSYAENILLCNVPYTHVGSLTERRWWLGIGAVLSSILSEGVVTISCPINL